MTMTAAALIAWSLSCSAQTTFEEVCASPHDYIWAEGWGRSVEEADIQALSSLCSAVSISVSSTYRLTETDRRTGSGITGESIIENTVSVFSCATLEGAGMEVLSKGRKAHVARWISRDEVARILSGREDYVKELVNDAMHARFSGRLGDELESLSEAAQVLSTIPRAVSFRMNVNGVGEVRLASWIPARTRDIIDGISVKAIAREGDIVTLTFTSDGRLVSGLDFRFFDGRSWSPMRHCSDGRVKVELSAGALGEHIQVMIGGVPADRALKIAERK